MKVSNLRAGVHASHIYIIVYPQSRATTAYGAGPGVGQGLGGAFQSGHKTRLHGHKAARSPRPPAHVGAHLLVRRAGQRGLRARRVDLRAASTSARAASTLHARRVDLRARRVDRLLLLKIR